MSIQNGTHYLMKNDKIKQQYRVNEQIHVREVRVVGDDIESSVMPTREAILLAERKGLDLVEISPNAVPPVCRIIDYSKFIYRARQVIPLHAHVSSIQCL